MGRRHVSFSKISSDFYVAFVVAVDIGLEYNYFCQGYSIRKVMTLSSFSYLVTY